MNASPNAKPPIPQTHEEEYRLSPQVEDTQLPLTTKPKEAQAHQFQDATSETVPPVDQFADSFDEIIQEEPQLSLEPVDLSSQGGGPNLLTELIVKPEDKVAENAIISSSNATVHPFDKEYIEIGDEKLPLTSVLESILFVADSPVAPAQIAKVLHLDLNRIESGLEALAQMYEKTGRGLRVQAREGKFLLITKPAVAAVIEDFLNLDTSAKLSTPALETLAVIAYRQPITRMQIEAVRGVDSAGVLRSLVQRGLVEEMGRLEVAGRPFLYGVTDLFMQHFGLTKIEDLPPLQSSEADTLWATTKLAELTELAS